MANQRPCKHCGKWPTKEGHDGCLGILPGVMNACCGHGPDGHEEPYVQFLDGFSITGESALIIMNELKKNIASSPFDWPAGKKMDLGNTPPLKKWPTDEVQKMKFTDEPPTEPGLYWANLGDKDPEPVRYEGGLVWTTRHCGWFLKTDFLWGDKIEIPEVEL